MAGALYDQPVWLFEDLAKIKFLVAIARKQLRKQADHTPQAIGA